VLSLLRAINDGKSEITENLGEKLSQVIKVVYCEQ